jgi:hypothetical protein
MRTDTWEGMITDILNSPTSGSAGVNLQKFLYDEVENALWEANELETFKRLESTAFVLRDLQGQSELPPATRAVIRSLGINLTAQVTLALKQQQRQKNDEYIERVLWYEKYCDDHQVAYDNRGGCPVCKEEEEREMFMLKFYDPPRIT